MSKTKKDVRNNKEVSSSSSISSSLSSDEEIDIQDLKPIKNYMCDRKELAHQLFNSVKPEKIRMMLPQTLKQVNLSELEQWCVSELSGMSKKRILSILNGKPFLESSDTSESDDSGPSLEIISDTEEWLTDDETSKKEDNGKGKLKRDKTKIKGKVQANKKNGLDKFNLKDKCSDKNEDSDKTKDIKIKKENDKEKEGDSLLDLLELEMRARAIRALIRKEEDIIPPVNLSQVNNSEITENSDKSLPSDDIKVEINCRKQLEKIINVKQGNIGEDEDVVLVVQPTPVVELLSSDSDAEGTQMNKKLEKECATKSIKFVENPNVNTKDSNKLNVQGLKERKEIQGLAVHSNIVNKTDSNTRNEGKTRSERNVDIKNNILSISISADNVKERRKKSKKKSRSKLFISSTCNTDENFPKLKKINISADNEQTNDKKTANINMQSTINLIGGEKDISVIKEEITKKDVSKKSRSEKEKSVDLDEIIDLDDYCDDMDIENCDEGKNQEEALCSQQENKQSISEVATNSQKSDSLETWASRYYQTDDVQNVIKESKIQSEIRKRLRERQRMSKLRNSPNLNLSVQSSTPAIPSLSEETTTGSVEEYLALKRTMNTKVNVNNSDNNIDTMQDIVPVVTSANDAKESLLQSESIISRRECTDRIDEVKKPVISEVLTAETMKSIISEKNDIQPG